MSAVAEGPPPQPSTQPEGPSQPSLRRMRRFGVRPDRELGQNFLIDSNILGVIGRAAALEPDDVVLEVGGGLGVLSEYLAEHAAHVHVVEIDERLRDALCDATDPHANVTVHWADAMAIDLAALEPAPDKVVANLPYGVAASVLLRTIEELPGVRTWVAMVQREVGERLAAGPVGSGGAGAHKSAYGVPSVLAQLECEVQVLRGVPRTVFHPVPNVDSVLVSMRRRGAGSDAGDAGAGAESKEVSPALRALVAAAFAHRRKTLSGSLGLAGASSLLPPRSREQVRAALTQLGHPGDVRAERLSPEDFRALARLLEL
jgi:16S rRNA (adenine1518-N6/adenine1519-N6)-dimethyltransferase